MGYDVKFLPGADRDLIEIDDYLSQFYPSTAAIFFEKLDKKLLLLKEQPYIGAKYIPNPEYRKLNVGDYLTFYTVDEENRKIEIYRILHGSRDMRQHLEDI
ncbi:MAG: type II toxin-antitoxin system RelE/ParE family toxin [Oscillospiraceae bacterium]|nr:type II toxin-antitoxin system RelE/ParE family toxin [Oscillospiraceae bacterium]